MTNDTEIIIITTFISGVFAIIGYILGGLQAKGIIADVGHNFSEKILKALQIADRGQIQNTKYDKLEGDFMIKLQDKTTGNDKYVNVL